MNMSDAILQLLATLQLEVMHLRQQVKERDERIAQFSTSNKKAPEESEG